MQATYLLKPFPFRIVALACGLLAAAIIGGTGGYWLKSLDHKGSSAAAAPATTARGSATVGENARQDSVLGTHTAVGSERTGSRAERDDQIGSAQQPSLVGEGAQPGPAAETAGRRR